MSGEEWTSVAYMADVSVSLNHPRHQEEEEERDSQAAISSYSESRQPQACPEMMKKRTDNNKTACIVYCEPGIELSAC